MELTLTALIKTIILCWGRGSSSGDKNLKLNKSWANLKCTSSPSLFSCNYWLVPNLTLANWESKVTAPSLLNFQSNYQIHLNLIIFQTMGWDLYVIRAICWLSKQPVFLNNLLKKVSSLLNSLHASPTHRVIKILLSFADSLSCHLLRLHVLLFQPCFHCCTNLNFHHLTTSCINGLDLSVWFSGRK